MNRRGVHYIGVSLIVLLSASGCGSTASKQAPPATTLITAEVCDSKTENSKPGNFDRFSFETETSEGSFTGFKNGKGEVVIEPTFGFAYEFGEGGIAAAVIRPSAANVEARAVFIDPSGKEVAQALMFDNGPDYFQSGYARIVNKTGLMGFIDRKGKIVITPQFVDAQGFCNGKAVVRDGSLEWEIDETGKRLTEKTPYTPEPEELD